MCLLTYFPPGVMPDTEALLNGTYVNDDGHGFAIVTTDQLIVRRGMDADAMIGAFDTARHQYPEGPALFHSRLSTHGHIDVDNCHPFPIGGDGRTVIAHNGVLPAAVQPTKGDPRSDTRIAAEDYLPSLGSLRSRRTRKRVELWMTIHNRMVILTVDRAFKDHAYILNEKSGTWNRGIWYSNNGYLPPPPGEYRPEGSWSRSPWYREAHNLDRCPCCQTILEPTETDCRYCGWCIDCGEMPEHCGCYLPASPERTHLGPVSRQTR